MVRSPDGYTDFFDIATRVFQGNIPTAFLFLICLDYVLLASIDLMKEDSLVLKKNLQQTISRRN